MTLPIFCCILASIAFTMGIFMPKRFFTLLFVILLSLSSTVSADDDAGLLGYFRRKYDDLPEKGKFATGAFVGFAGSRATIRSAVTVVKVAGAAFVASEALNAAGVLDDIPSLSEEQTEMAESLKRRALTYAGAFRTSIRRRLDPENIKSMMETDRMVTLGFTAGAFVGFVL